MGANLGRKQTVVTSFDKEWKPDRTYSVPHSMAGPHGSKAPSPLFIVVFDAHHMLVDAVSLDFLSFLGYTSLKQQEQQFKEFYHKSLDNLISFQEKVKVTLRDAPASVMVTDAKLVKADGSLHGGWNISLYRIVSPTIIKYAAVVCRKNVGYFPDFLSFLVDGQQNLVSGSDCIDNLDDDVRKYLQRQQKILEPGLVYRTMLEDGRHLVTFYHNESLTCCGIVSMQRELVSPVSGWRSVRTAHSFSTGRGISKSGSFLHPVVWNILERQTGVILVDANNRIMSANKQILHVLGYSMDNLRHQSIAHILATSESRELVEDIALRMEGSLPSPRTLWPVDGTEHTEWEGELRFLRADKAQLTVQCKIIRGYPSAEGFVLFVELTHQDEVTQNLQKAKSFKDDKESQLRAIIDTTADAIVTIDSKGTIRNFNRSAELIFGYSADEIIGQNISELMPQPHRINHDKYINRYLETGENKIIGIGREIQALRKNGETFPMELAISEASFKGKLYFTGIIRDISSRKAAEQALEKERQKTEDLLASILPKQIAERLKHEDNKVIADRFDDASVLFCDLVGFTNMSSKISPPELVKFLNQVYSMFDQLEDHHPVTKIKTIGDAYMVVSGVPEPFPEHHKALANFALDMVDCVRQFNMQYGQNINIRIGMNSGPLVGGVIGRKQFSYDIWGDTVNVASRMESGGVPGRIHVSEPCYEALKDTYNFEERGTIDVKGKGKMRSYFLVESKKPRTETIVTQTGDVIFS